MQTDKRTNKPTNEQNGQTNSPRKPFGEDLEERCFRFARDVGRFCRSIKKDTVLFEYVIQVIRSSGSIGANYIEANESLGKADFKHRCKISRKEAKESRYWLRLIRELLVDPKDVIESDRLIQEAKELMLIFNSIISKIQ